MPTHVHNNKPPRMTRAHYLFIADTLGPMVSWPSQIQTIADELARTNPRFNRERFINRAVKAWEANHKMPEIDDEIPY